ncbi:hypothetical protein KAR91_61875, partial [Candidatus Pacearchaeota archaeon]|nr:hypothetical protein [Candidatus Pacearchaeota archaeon]
MVRTSNGGTNWATVSTGTSGDHFYGVDFVSSTQGWMVDDDGDIRVTSNGGDNWTLQTSGTVQWLRDIQMLNSSTGYAVGGLETVLKTINGGTDWTTQTTPGSQYLYDIYCTDASNCWAVGNGGTIIHTSNGGTDWTAQTSGTTTILRAVHFSDANNGWVAGDSGMTLYTTNGGTTWTEEDTDSARRINGIWVFSATSVLETGDKNPSAPIILKRGAIKTESSTALPTPAGETLNFVVTDSDPNLDDYYLLVCKNSSAPTGGAPPECNGGSGNRWARSAATTSGTKATASYVTSGSDAISNDWWAFTCDASDCSSASQGSGNSGSPFIVNHGPTLSNFAVVEANDPTDITPDPGEQLQFQFTSSDQDSDDHTIVVCDSSGFTDSTQTCVSEEICRLNPEEVATTFTDEGTVTPNAVGIDVISRDIAFAVGASGYIGKTTNGGTSWTTATSPYSLQYWGLSAIDEKTAWAVGVIDSGGTNEGTIVATINGTTWSAQTSGVAQDLWDVFFVDANYGWAVGNGGTIIATTNGGTNWSAQTSGTANDLNAISFLDRNNGWVAGSNGTILVTTNGGTNWSAQTSGTANYLASIEMVNKDVGYAGSVSTMRKTTNGGTTWSAANWPGVNFNGMHWVDENIGFVAANNGGMYYTTDGAATAFNSISTGSSSTMWSVDCTDKNFCMVGSSESNSHKIINEVATASAWSSLTSGTSTTTNDLEFIDENNGWIALGSGAVRRTNDGGDNWSASTTGSSSILMDIHFIDPQVGWIVGTSGEVRKTTTGGASDDPNCAGTDHWCTQTSGETTTIRGIHFVDADNGWFVGDSGKIRVTSDGGTTWTTQTSGTAETLRKADFIDPDTGWIVGHSGTILVTSNGGGTWTGQTSGTSNHLYDVSFVDSQYGWASGGSGTILTTSNGGTVWTAQTSGVSSNLYGIKMIDKNTGWTVGIGGEVLFTADGGTTWTAQTSGTASDLWGIAFISENIGFAAGGTGTVIKVSSLSYCNETDSDPNDGDPSPVYIGVPEAHGSKAYTIHTFDEHNVPDDGTDESQNFSVGDVPPYISNNTDYTVTDITLTA